MLVLALDTALDHCQAVVIRLPDGAVLGAASAPAAGDAEAVVGHADAVLAEAGATFADLSRIAVTVGPGSFTGVRVGIAYARGLAFALAVPAAGISTLEAMARQVDAPVVTAVDARHGAVFAGQFPDADFHPATIGRLPLAAALALARECGGFVAGTPSAVAALGEGRVVERLDLVAVARASAARDASIPPRALYLAQSTRHRSATKPWRERDDYGQLIRKGCGGEAALVRISQGRGNRSGLNMAEAPDGGTGHGDASGSGMIGWLSGTPAVSDVQPHDFDTLEEIHAASFVAPWSADEQASLNDQPNVRTFVARRGTSTRRPVGFITVRRAADEAEVLTMAVHPRHRRAGVGRLLLEAALRHLYAERINEVFLEVDPDNEAALALYGRAGFTSIGERPEYYAGAAGRRKAVTMRLRLEQPALVRS